MLPISASGPLVAFLAGDEKAEGVPLDFAMRSGSTCRTMVSLSLKNGVSHMTGSVHTESMAEKCSQWFQAMLWNVGDRQAGDNALVGNVQHCCLFCLFCALSKSAL